LSFAKHCPYIARRLTMRVMSFLKFDREYTSHTMYNT